MIKNIFFFYLMLILFLHPIYAEELQINLKQSIKKAMVNNLETINQKIKQEKAYTKKLYMAQKLLIPNFETSVTWQQNSMNEVNDSNSQSIDMKISMDIFSLPTKILKYKIAEKKYSLEKLSLESIKEDIIELTIKKYFSLLLLKKKIKLLKNFLTISEKRVKSAQEKFKSGVISQSDLLEYKIDFINIKSDLLGEQQEYNSMKLDFSNFIGLPLNVNMNLEGTEIKFSEVNWEELQRGLQKKNKELAINTDKTEVKKTICRQKLASLLLPTTFIFAKFNYGKNTLANSDNWGSKLNLSWGFGMNLNLMNMLYAAQSSRQSKLDYIISKNQLNDTSSRLKFKAQTILNSYISSLEEVKLKEKMVKLASKNSQNYNKLFLNGRIELISLLNVEQKERKTKLELYESILKAKKYEVGLQKLQGKLLLEYDN